MALTQSGENQRKIGVNLSKIIGLKNNADKMQALNMERQKGGFNAVYFNGLNAGTETGGTDPTCTECGGSGGGSGGGGGGSGGGSGGGGVIMPCEDECVTLAEAAEMTADGRTPCCVKGAKKCDTGEDIPICLSVNCGGGGRGQGCVPPDTQNEYALTQFIWGAVDGRLCGGQWGEAGIGETGCYNLSEIMAKYEELKGKTSSACGCDSSVIEDTNTLRNNSQGTPIGSARYIEHKECTGSTSGNIGLSITALRQCNEPTNPYKKPAGYFYENGKFYENCSISGEDCFTVCDENGNQYKICANNGKPKVTPVA